MATKRKIILKKKVEEEKLNAIEEETSVSTVIENEINEIQERETKKSADKVIGTVGNSIVAKPKGQIRFEAQVAPVPLFRLPADIRQYLINKGLPSDVYKRDKEWLEKHNVDMEMVNKLKDFLTHL